MADTARCEGCGKMFPSVAKALAHAQKAHGVTRQQVQNERKLHGKRR